MADLQIWRRKLESMYGHCFSLCERAASLYGDVGQLYD